ncbi:nuclear transport factor 2 family protein [Akkermansiaceae bacterium]|nr:nuclear transport factor 2 family protein [bacterium]MDB4500730.1 nuclear transport factor 2 family protein [Akkermansiaceae bacterium]
MTYVFFHPITTFIAGALIAVIVLSLVLISCSGPNETPQFVESYRTAMNKAGNSGPSDRDAALKNFTSFLKNVGNKDYIEKNTAKVYAPGSYLNDTLVTHHGPEEIQAYFLETADTMTSFELTIDDSVQSGPDHYIRWTMIFAAPKLSSGKAIHSVGMSQVRFAPDGKVAFHQDFWDSGQNIYGQIPVVGGMIGIIQKQLD